MHDFSDRWLVIAELRARQQKAIRIMSGTLSVGSVRAAEDLEVAVGGRVREAGRKFKSPLAAFRTKKRVEKRERAVTEAWAAGSAGEGGEGGGEQRQRAATAGTWAAGGVAGGVAVLQLQEP